MKTDRILPTLLVLLFLILAVILFVAFASKLLGRELLVINIPVLPNLENLFIYFALLNLVGLISLMLAFLFAKVFENQMFGIFDSRWLPKIGEAETYTTVNGERLEYVAIPSFYATTMWYLATQMIFSVIALNLIVSAIFVVMVIIDKPSILLVGGLIIVVADFTIIAWTFWVKEWRRRYTKFIVFTTMVFYSSVRTPILSLLTGVGTLPKALGKPINQLGMGEKHISADPQDFDKSYQTSWFRDQYISWLARKRNLRTLGLISIFETAEEPITWIENGPGLLNLLNVLTARSQQPKKSQNKIKTEPLTYDLFRIKDPGIYNKYGNTEGTKRNVV